MAREERDLDTSSWWDTCKNALLWDSWACILDAPDSVELNLIGEWDSVPLPPGRNIGEGSAFIVVAELSWAVGGISTLGSGLVREICEETVDELSMYVSYIFH